MVAASTLSVLLRAEWTTPIGNGCGMPWSMPGNSRETNESRTAGAPDESQQCRMGLQIGLGGDASQQYYACDTHILRLLASTPKAPATTIDTSMFAKASGDKLHDLCLTISSR